MKKHSSPAKETGTRNTDASGEIREYGDLYPYNSGTMESDVIEDGPRHEEREREEQEPEVFENEETLYEESFEISKDSVSSVSVYKKIRERHNRYPEYKDMHVDKILYLYHIEETDKKKREWLRDEIFLRVYFLIPYTIKKHYFMSADLFNDASQNMAVSILQAIEAFQPGIGFSFTNYLVGYFRGAIAQSFRETNIVSIPSARRKMLRSVTEYQGRTAHHEAVSISEIDNTGIYNECDTEAESDAGEPKAVDVEMQEGVGAALYNAPTTATLFDDNASCHTQRNSRNIDFDEKLHKQQLVEFLEDALSSEAGVLSDDECRVIILHNGLFGHEEMVYRDIAKLRKAEGKGCAPSRISQIHTSALSKLREHFQRVNLEEY